MDTSEIKDRQVNQLKKKYGLCVFIIILLTLIIIALLIRAENQPQTKVPLLFELSNALFSICIALLVAAILQYLRDKKFLNNIDETIARQISMDVKGEVIKIRDIKNAILPDEIFWSEEVKLRREQIRSFSETTRIRFMSISATGLLKRAIPNIEPKEDVYIELLLLNPTNNASIKIRSDQLAKHEPEKTPEKLKEEIIESILNAHAICQLKGMIFIKVRLHDEIPSSRVELTDRLLYLSFFKSQVSGDNKGPVAKYTNNSDIHNAFSSYFSDTWNAIPVEREINVKAYNDIDLLKGRLKNLMNGELEQIINASKPTIEETGK